MNMEIYTADLDKINNYHEIQYEHLISEPLSVVSEVCSFLDIEFSESILDLPVIIEKYGSVKKSDSIDSNNFNKYITQLSKRKIKLVEQYTSPFIEKIGYEKEFDTNGKTPMKVVRYMYRIYDNIMYLSHFILREHGIKKGLSLFLNSLYNKLKQY